MNRKVTVVGGAGNVGATVARCIADKELADVVIVDIADQKAAGVALDILEACPITGSDSRVIGGADYARALKAWDGYLSRFPAVDARYDHAARYGSRRTLHREEPLAVGQPRSHAQVRRSQRARIRAVGVHDERRRLVLGGTNEEHVFAVGGDGGKSAVWRRRSAGRRRLPGSRTGVARDDARGEDEESNDGAHREIHG